MSKKVTGRAQRVGSRRPKHRKALSFFLTLLMLLSLMPVGAFALNDDKSGEGVAEEAVQKAAENDAGAATTKDTDTATPLALPKAYGIGDVSLSSFRAWVRAGGVDYDLYELTAGQIPVYTDYLLKNNDSLSFEFGWENSKNIQFEPGDTVTIPILRGSYGVLAAYSGHEIDLVLPGGDVQVGTGRFVRTQDEEAGDSLDFVITFEELVKGNTIDGGYANGSARIYVDESGGMGNTGLIFENSSELHYFGYLGAAVLYKSTTKDANAPDEAGWRFDVDVETRPANNARIAGALFHVYESEEDAQNNTDALYFVKENALHTYDPTGSKKGATQSVGTASGYGYLVLNGLELEKTYYVKEYQAPLNYLLCDDILEFTVNEGGTTVKHHVLYNEPREATGVPGYGGLSPWYPDYTVPNPEPQEALNKKIVSSPNAENGITVGDLGHIFKPLPDRGGKSYPSFQWGAPFFGLQDDFEASVDEKYVEGGELTSSAFLSGKSYTDYVILEDTVSANLAFSNFQNGSVAMDESGPLSGKNDNPYFFALEIPFKIFGHKDAFIRHSYRAVGGTTVPGSSYSHINVTQDKLTLIVEDEAAREAAKKIYTDPAYRDKIKIYAELGSYSDVDSAVRATPLSYGLLGHTDGKTTLLINAGRFGSEVPEGEGIESTHLSDSLSPSATASAGVVIPELIGGMTRIHGWLTKAYAAKDSPYSRVVYMIDQMDQLMEKLTPASDWAEPFSNYDEDTSTYSPYDSSSPHYVGTDYATAYGLASADWNRMKKILAEDENEDGTPDGGFLKGGEIGAAVGSYKTAWRIYGEPGAVASSPIKNLNLFLKTLANAETVPTDDYKGYDGGSNNEPGAKAQASWELDKNDTRRAAQATVSQVGYNYDRFLGRTATTYSTSMKNLANNVERWAFRRDAYLETALFYFPDLRKALVWQLKARNSNLVLSEDATNDELIEALFKDKQYGPGGTEENYEKWYQTWVELSSARGTASGGYTGIYGFGNWYYWSQKSGFEGNGAGVTLNAAFFHDLSVAAVNLKYRSILTGTLDSAITNNLKVTVGASDEAAEEEYRYRYSAGIFGSANGGAVFLKADTRDNTEGGPGWVDFEDEADALYSPNEYGRPGGAQFSIYADVEGKPDTTSPLSFIQGRNSEAHVFTYDSTGSAAGSTTIITVPEGGGFTVERLPAEARYWIQEITPPPGYLVYGEPHGFTVSGSGNAPNYYALYDTILAVSCEVDKDTIKRTSAAYVSLPGKEEIDNVGQERYRYDVDFRSTASVDTDEFVVDDPLENVRLDQVRLEEVWTALTWGDADGKFNVWYKTNLTDDSSGYSDVAAKSDAESDVESDGEQASAYPNTGYKLWAQELDAGTRHHLYVSDLNLAEDEYVTATRYEYGAVKVGFTSKNYSDTSLNGEHREVSHGEIVLPSENADKLELFSDTFASGTSAVPNSINGDVVDWTPNIGRVDYAEGALNATGLKPASYLVSAVRAMATEDIVSSVSARIARDYSLRDLDQDAVVTRELATFTTDVGEGETPPDPLQSTYVDNEVDTDLDLRTTGGGPLDDPSSNPSSSNGSATPLTGDPLRLWLWIALLSASTAAVFLLFSPRRKRVRKPMRRKGGIR